MATIEFEGRMVQYDETVISRWSFQHKALKASQIEFVHLMADVLFEDQYAVAEQFGDSNEKMTELILAICKEMNENAKN